MDAHRAIVLVGLAAVGLTLGGGAAAGGSAAGATTQRVSLSSAGRQANGGSLEAMIAADGRYVVFTSFASNLIRRDTNRESDVYVRDLRNGTTRRVSVGPHGRQIAESWFPSISADGRYVAFRSLALLPPEQGYVDGSIYVRDRVAKTTRLVSMSSAGVPANDASVFSLISRDGRVVVFESKATNLVPGDTNGIPDVFLRDLARGTTVRLSVSSTGAQGTGGTTFPQPGFAISGNDRYVAFLAEATNLVRHDTNGVSDVFVRDRVTHTTTRVSVGAGGVQANGATAGGVSISGDGRYVAFASQASNLVPGDTNDVSDVFVRDRVRHTTVRISNAAHGGSGAYSPAISPDGRIVAYVSENADGLAVIVAYDRATGQTRRISVGRNGGVPNLSSELPSISADDRWIAFSSYASNLVAGDTNRTTDVFVRGPLRFSRG